MLVPPARKCALIVDDSPTAREVLGRMLAQYQLRVATAESAEEALEFLVHQRPDVIFMDHLMPGMDGFQAVRAIKANPATATIPVMMYTSQSGELYVGQARALGAVGVLPKQIRPVEVAEVLRSLHLFPEEPTPAAQRGPAELPGVDTVMGPGDWTDLHRWLQEMLLDHSRSLKADLEASVTRILADHLAPRPAAAPGSAGRRPAWPTGALIGALAVVAAVFFWLHLDAQTRWQAAVRQNQSLMAALDARRADTATLALPAPGSPAPGATLPELLPAIEWSINQAATYPPGELPFSDERLETLAGLLEQLRTLGFRGTVVLESHVGDFCQSRDGTLGYEPAPPDLPATACDRVGYPPDEARTLAAGQSIAFANYLGDLASPRGGSIRVRLEAIGNGRPRQAYPGSREGLSAGDWNRVAAANHRVEVRLLPDGLTAAAVPGG